MLAILPALSPEPFCYLVWLQLDSSVGYPTEFDSGIVSANSSIPIMTAACPGLASLTAMALFTESCTRGCHAASSSFFFFLNVIKHDGSIWSESNRNKTNQWILVLPCAVSFKACEPAGWSAFYESVCESTSVCSFRLKGKWLMMAADLHRLHTMTGFSSSSPPLTAASSSSWIPVDFHYLFALNLW